MIAQAFGIGRGIRAGAMFLCCGIALASAVPAAADDMLTPGEFCMLAEDSFSARRVCERDYERSLMLFLQYGQQEGYVDSSGGFSFRRVLKDMWSWRILVGLPPASPFLNCSQVAFYGGAPYDFRQVWDCIAAADPRAAKMDAI